MSAPNPSTDPIIWIDDATGNIGTVDLTTDAVTLVGPSGQELTDIAFNPSGQLFGETSNALYSIDQTSGAATEIGPLGGNGELNGLTFGSDGTLYSSGGSDLYTVNPTTGAATLVGDLGLGSGYASAGDLAFNGGQLYESVGAGFGASDLVRVDPATGAGTIVGEIVGDPNVLGLVTASNGTLYGVDGTKIYSIDTQTGVGTLVENYGSSSLNIAYGAASETEAVAPCYAGGTRILTQRGEIAVEQLHVGDRVVALLDQGLVAIRWLGHRTLNLRNHPCPDQVRPVRICAGAFSNGLPYRDLRVSPGHALYVDGVLIQAERLVNGVTILQEDVPTVTYWHVELERHDVLLAEGLPAESYLDTGNRTAFVNGGAFLELHPDFRPRHWAETCAPLVQDGPVLEAVKARLLARAGGAFNAVVTSDTGLHLLADGVVVEPCSIEAKCYRFQVPAGAQRIQLVSRVWVPSQMLSASTDTRALGVCVRQLVVDGQVVALDNPRLSTGWDKLERDASGEQRWTHGCATVPMGVTELEVQLDGFAIYWKQGAATAALAAA